MPNEELAGPGVGDPARGAHSGTGVAESIGIVQSDPVIKCMVLKLIAWNGHSGLRRASGHRAPQTAGAPPGPVGVSRQRGSHGARASSVASCDLCATAAWDGRSKAGGRAVYRAVANHPDHSQPVMAGVSHAVDLQSMRCGMVPSPQPACSAATVRWAKSVKQRGPSGKDGEWASFSSVIKAYINAT